MSRLGPALRVRRRELDRLALAIASERQRGAAAAELAQRLVAQREEERRCPVNPTWAADAWFAQSLQDLQTLRVAEAESERRLAGLRRSAAAARARLNLLEEAHEASRAAERRLRDKAAQAALDDRSAAGWKGQ